MWSSRFLWRLLQRTACIWYVPARASPEFCLVWGVNVCASVIVCVYYFLLVFVLPRYFFLSGVIGACPVTTECVCVFFTLNRSFYPPTSSTTSRCPWRFFNPRRDTSYVVTNLRHTDTTLPRTWYAVSTARAWAMQRHVIILDTTSPIYTFYEILQCILLKNKKSTPAVSSTDRQIHQYSTLQAAWTLY